MLSFRQQAGACLRVPHPLAGIIKRLAVGSARRAAQVTTSSAIPAFISVLTCPPPRRDRPWQASSYPVAQRSRGVPGEDACAGLVRCTPRQIALIVPARKGINGEWLEGAGVTNIAAVQCSTCVTPACSHPTGRLPRSWGSKACGLAAPTRLPCASSTRRRAESGLAGATPPAGGPYVALPSIELMPGRQSYEAREGDCLSSAHLEHGANLRKPRHQTRNMGAAHVIEGAPALRLSRDDRPGCRVLSRSPGA